MDKFKVLGGTKLRGEIKVSGAKNVAMKVVLASLLTEKPVVVHNIPMVSSVLMTVDLLKKLGVKVKAGHHHDLELCGKGVEKFEVPLDFGGLCRTATMVIGPLLTKFGKAVVPNPGGCRLGKRPIDRHIEGLRQMGAKITPKEGFFIASAKKLHGIRYKFSKNTHTGTESMILATVLAEGETVLENCAQEPEVDDLIRMLNLMGAKIRRSKPRTIVVAGVEKLDGVDFTIMPDRNEVVTFAIGAIASGGDVLVKGCDRHYLKAFLQKLDEIKAGWEPVSSDTTRFYHQGKLLPTAVETGPYPKFMTDWQAPWAILMTQAQGLSTIHETVYEDRFGYVKEMRKMGAKIDFYDPKVKNPKDFYNFNWSDRIAGNCQAIRIHGPAKLHNAVLEMTDLRAGATLVLGAIIASGESIIHGVNHIDRGYEKIEERLQKLGARIRRIRDEE